MKKTNKTIKFNLLAILCLILAACAGQQHLTDQKAAEESIECKYDDFSKLTTCTSEYTSTDKPMGSIEPSVILKFVSSISTDKKATVGLNGRVSSFGWLYPNYALDKDGKKFAIEKTGSETNSCGQYFGCSTWEHVYIPLDRKYITDKTTTGFTLKVYGDKGTATVDFPAPFVTGFNNMLKNKGI